MKSLCFQRVMISHKIAICVLMGLLAAQPAPAAKKGGLFKDGKKAEASGNYDEALANYEKALAEDPQNSQYLVSTRRVRFLAAMQHVDRGHKLRDQGRLAEALQDFERANAIDPSSIIAEQEMRRTMAMMEAQKAAGGKPQPPLSLQQLQQRASEQRMLAAESPAELAPLSRAPVNLRATNESKVIFETIGKLAGINVLADPAYQGKRISVELNNVTLEDALDHTGVLSKTLWKALTPNTILIYPDSMRREHDPQVIKTVYLSNTIQPTELTEIAQTLRNLLEMTKIQQVNSQNAIVMKDTPDKVAIAEKIINDIDKAKPEVVVDVAVIQVQRTSSRQLGISPVSSAGPGIQVPLAFTPGGATSSSITTGTGTAATTSSTGTSVTLNRLGRLSSGDFSVILPGGTLNALMSDARTKILQNPQVRASDGLVAKLRIGERIPIATGSFQPGIGGVGINPLVNTQFQYTDVGVIMEITPKVHAGREVSMKVIVEISAVTQRVNLGGIEQPVIGQRRVEEEIRLREGEVNILGGIIESQESRSTAGVPILGQIPILGRFFSTEKKDTNDNEVLIVLVPHIVRVPEITELNLRGIDVGTQTNLGLHYRQPAAKPGGGEPSSPAPPRGSAATGAPAPAPDTSLAPAPIPPEIVPPSVPSGTQLRFLEIPADQAVGTTFNLDLEIRNANNVLSVPFQVRFPSKLLKLVNVTQGNFLRKDDKAVALSQAIDAEAGAATLSLTRPPDAPGVSGSGTLATLTFQALGAGTATVEVVRGSARGAGNDSQALPAAQATVNIK